MLSHTSFKLTTFPAGEDLEDPPELKKTRSTRMQRTMAMPRGLTLIEPPRFILGHHNLSSVARGSPSKGSATAMMMMVQSPAEIFSCSLSICFLSPPVKFTTTCSHNLTPDLSSPDLAPVTTEKVSFDHQVVLIETL